MIAGDAFLRVDYEADREKSLLRGNLRPLEDGARQDVEAGVIRMTVLTPDVRTLVVWAGRLVIPADRFQVGHAEFLIR